MRLSCIMHPYLDRFSNSFILHTEAGEVLIDTGLYSGRHLIDLQAPQPIAVLCTHGHWDHTGGHAYFRAKGAKICSHRGDARQMGDLELQWRTLYEQFAGELQIPPERRETYAREAGSAVPIDEPLEDSQILQFGEATIQVIHTPGHSQGSVCYYLEHEGLLFTGDTLCGAGFFGGLPQIADPQQYVQSLQRLRQLQPTAVYSAHTDGCLDNARYRTLIEEGLACAGRLREDVQQFLHETGGAPFRIGQVADLLCQKEHRSGGSGAFVTALAYLMELGTDLPSVQHSCRGLII